MLDAYKERAARDGITGSVRCVVAMIAHSGSGRVGGWGTDRAAEEHGGVVVLAQDKGQQTGLLW